MEIVISTTEEKEKEVKTSFARSFQNIAGYNLPLTDIRVEFVCGEEDHIRVRIAIHGTKDAFGVVNSLQKKPADFFNAIAEDLSEELFKYLLFNNRISYMAFYLKLYKKVKLSVTEEVFGRTYQHTFIINK